MKEHPEYQQNELVDIEEFQDIRSPCNQPDLLIRWTGYAEQQADWVNIETIQKKVPYLLKE